MKGQVWMKSYMGHAVTYHAADRTYTISRKDKDEQFMMSDATDSVNASNGSAGAKPVRNPEREKPKAIRRNLIAVLKEESGIDNYLILHN